MIGIHLLRQVSFRLESKPAKNGHRLWSFTDESETITAFNSWPILKRPYLAQVQAPSDSRGRRRAAQRMARYETLVEPGWLMSSFRRGKWLS